MANRPSLQVFTEQQMALAMLARCQTVKVEQGGMNTVMTVNPIRIIEDNAKIEIIEEIDGIERVFIFWKA